MNETEARAMIARLDCQAHGHDWTIIEDRTKPVLVTCRRCGTSHQIQQEEE